MSHIDDRMAELGFKRKKRFKVVVPERNVLASILEYLELHPLVAWVRRMNSGAIKIDKRFIRYGFIGCADIIGQLKDGRFIAIECKSTIGQVTEAQKEFIALVQRNNGIAGVARRLEDVEAIMGSA